MIILAGNDTKVGHIADRLNDGKALCGVDLPLKRIGGEPGPGVFCPDCEQRWEPSPLPMSKTSSAASSPARSAHPSRSRAVGATRKGGPHRA